MGRKKDEDEIKQIKDDDRNLSIAQRRWEEAALIEDPAVNILSEIREAVEKDD